jgi:hypothetical protein
MERLSVFWREAHGHATPPLRRGQSGSGFHTAYMRAAVRLVARLVLSPTGTRSRRPSLGSRRLWASRLARGRKLLCFVMAFTRARWPLRMPLH